MLPEVFRVFNTKIVKDHQGLCTSEEGGAEMGTVEYFTSGLLRFLIYSLKFYSPNSTTFQDIQKPLI